MNQTLPIELDPLQHRSALEEALRRAVHAVEPLTAGDPGYVAACEHLLAAGADLVEWERQLPSLLDTGPHRTSKLLLIGSGVVAMLAGVGLLVSLAGGAVSRWWLPVVPLLLVVGWLVLRTPVRPPLAGHQRQRPAAVAVAAGALLAWCSPLFGTDPARLWLAATAGLLLLLGVGGLRAAPVAPNSVRVAPVQDRP